MSQNCYVRRTAHWNVLNTYLQMAMKMFASGWSTKVADRAGLKGVIFLRVWPDI